MLKLALTPKWIAALVGCILLGIVFAFLAQWQVSRSVLPGSIDKYNKIEYVSLTEVADPGKPFTFIELDDKRGVLKETLVFVKAEPSKAFLVQDRFQTDGRAGSWLVVPALTTEGKLFMAVGFISAARDQTKALAEIQALPSSANYVALRGRYLPSEAPQKFDSGYHSLSIAQLINDVQFGTKLQPVYTGFLALTEGSKYSQVEHVEPLTIDPTKFDSGLNWLSVFYALEWAFFALFAVFMWWRLLADAYRKQQEALLEQAN